MSVPPLAESPYTSVTYDFLEQSLLVVIHHRLATLDDASAVFDSTFRALSGANDAGLFVPAGPAMAIYTGSSRDGYDLELGFPVLTAPTQPIPTTAGTIHASALPSGPVAILSHTGSHETLTQSWTALRADAGEASRGVWIETYVSHPARTAPEERRTDLLLPLRS